MICLCGKPMATLKTVVGGHADSTDYVTFEVKVCKPCNRYVLEHYQAREIQKETVAQLIVNGFTDKSIKLLLN